MEQTIDTRSNKDESQIPCAKSRGQTQRLLLYNSIYRAFWRRQTFREGKQIGGGQQLRGGLGKQLTTKGHERPFWSNGDVLHLDFDDGDMTIYIYQNS